jgi:hypothetical protein
VKLLLLLSTCSAANTLGEKEGAPFSISELLPAEEAKAVQAIESGATSGAIAAYPQCQQFARLLPQVDSDFAPWEKSVVKDARRQQYSHHAQPHLRVQIIRGSVWVTDGPRGATSYESRGLSYAELLWATAMAFQGLPDAQFILVTDDKGCGNYSGQPVLAGLRNLCTTRVQQDGGPAPDPIMVPDSTMFNWGEARSWGLSGGQRQVSLAAADASPWDSRTGAVFWRGSFTHAIRNNWSKKFQDATKFPNIDIKVTQFNSVKTWVTLADHCKYKYLANFRGNGPSGRAGYLLLCGSVFIRSMPPGPEPFWFSLMKKDVEYVEADINSIEKVVDNLRDNDEQAKKMGQAAQNFATKYLSGPSVLCYYAEVVTRISRLQKIDGSLPISPAKGMRPVEEYMRMFGKEKNFPGTPDPLPPKNKP